MINGSRYAARTPPGGVNVTWIHPWTPGPGGSVILILCLYSDAHLTQLIGSHVSSQNNTANLKSTIKKNQRDNQWIAPDSCKVRVAKSVFSIRSLVDLGDGSEKLEDGEAAVIQCGELFFFLATHASHNVSLN
ncbi:hypothetical protein QE152_g15636 [Popillia japonica]|uniref:Uncharacterized protein n=1 Tax=Popillia japonica TaxID=7064 RepID=A0AAW1L7I1_POPJA